MNEKSNKLISVVSGLSRTQRRSCKKLLQSPWFGGNKDLLVFFEEITRRLDRDKPLDKREIWQSVLGKKKPYNDVRFRKYTSDLFKLVQEFLTQEALEAEPELKHYLYLAALERQNPDKLIRGIERNWENLRGPEKSFQYTSYLYRHLLEDRKYSLLNYEHRPYEHANVEEISASLDIYYIVVKLRNAVYSLSENQNKRQQYQLQMVEEVIGFLNQNNVYLKHPVVAIYYYMYQMLAQDDHQAAYFQFRATVMKHADELGNDQAFELFQPALNYCRRRINEGNKDFLQEYMDVYKYALQRGLVFDDGVLDPLQFRNTITFALRLGEYEWAEHYIENYQERLPEKQRLNAVNYNSALLYFYSKNYDKALDYLRDVEYENVTYNLSAKAMLLSIYYETEADISLDSLFDSFNAYLNRHKELPTSAQEAFRNLITFTRRLTRLFPNDKKALEQLKTDLSGKKYVASRPWLESKIAERESRSRPGAFAG